MSATPDITIRDFAPTDFEPVIALWSASEGVGLNECDTREGITAYLQRNPGLSLVAADSSVTMRSTVAPP